MQLVLQDFSLIVIFIYIIQDPDLVHRLRNNLELNLEYDYSTFFGGGEKGYTDFKPYHEWKKWGR